MKQTDKKNCIPLALFDTIKNIKKIQLLSDIKLSFAHNDFDAAKFF